MKRLRHSVLPWIKATCDYAVLLLGITAIAMAFFSPYDEMASSITSVAGICGIVYFTFIVFVFLGSRPRFDWHLVNGKYILKVISIVLLAPFSLSLVISNSSNPVLSKDLLSEDMDYVQEEAVAGNLSMEPTTVSDQLNADQEDLSLFWSVYYHFIDPGNQHMASGKEGKQWAALIAILGVFLVNGLLVSTIIGWVDTRKERWQKGAVRYKLLTWRRHYVILGVNDMVDGVVQQLLKKDKGCISFLKPYILIQTSQDVESFRRTLFSNLTQAQQKRIVIYYGSRTSQVDISKLGLGTALEVYVLGEEAGISDMESYHDTINMECLKCISNEIADCRKFELCGEQDNRLVCRVMFEYQTSFNVFKITDIDTTKIRFLPFNYYEQWAQNVLINRTVGEADESKQYYLPLEGLKGIKSGDTAYVHLVVVGMSRMGIAMAIEAAQLAHYPNYETMGKRTRITFIDNDADKESEFFRSRFRDLFALSHWSCADIAGDKLVWQKHEPELHEHLGGDFIDVEWEFINASIELEPVQNYLIDASSDKDARLTIAMCMPENSRAVAAAVYLPDKIFKSDSTLRVLVYQRLNEELLRQISDNNDRYCKKIKAFGMAKECYDSYLTELSEHLNKAMSKAYMDYQFRLQVERMKEDGYTEEEARTILEARNAAEKNPVENKKRNNIAAVGMWSNYYSIHSMWTKFRCVTTSDKHVFNPLTEDLDEGMLNELGHVEHNRWLIERLMLRFRPLTKEEQEQAKIPTLCSSPENMKKLKNSFAHLDICSNKILDKVDFNVSELDKELIKVLIPEYRRFLYEK